MSSITLNEIRVGNFTSSEAIRLTGIGKRKMTPEELSARPKSGTGSSAKTIEDKSILSDSAYEYISECNMERRLGRSIESEENARNLSWGKIGEKYISVNPDLLGLEYSINLSDTTAHPEIDYWVGSEDASKEDTIVEIKCPRTMKSFCQLVDPYMEDGKIIHPALTIEAVRANHKDGDKYYYQIVSNACIHNKQYGELIVFCPFQSELQKIRELASNWDNPEDAWKFSWVFSANDTELPYLIDGGYYNNINIIRFEIPQADKDFLTGRVVEAGKLLIPRSEE